MTYKVSDIDFELLSRFIELEELGFQKCIDVDETGHHEVYSIGSPENGLRLMDVLKMPQEDFTSLKAKYIN